MNYLSNRITAISFLLLASLLSIAQNLTLPNFTSTTGTVLSNTNGNWVRIDPAQPNNIDLIETRIFEMPKKGSGVKEIEFELVGADGGTARYLSGAIAHGGKGAVLRFKYFLAGSHGMPFMITFGKKGESLTNNSFFYCSSGGGGSTGMAILRPNVVSYRMSFVSTVTVTNFGLLVAAAGGGGGGFATVNGVYHGAGAGFLVSNPNGGILDDPYSYYSGSRGASTVTLPAGGSKLSSLFGVSTCCDIEKISRKTTSFPFNSFNFSTGVIVGSPGLTLQSLTFGQGGGQPQGIVTNAQQTSNGVTSVSTGFNITKLGGRGGCGFGGGGAGVSNTDAFNFSLPSNFLNKIPTSGGGGTGALYNNSMPGLNLNGGQGGASIADQHLGNVSNVSIAPATTTNNPQSGSFMYRTIADDIPPVVTANSLTLYLGNDIFGFPASSVSLNAAALANTCTDNDSVKTIAFSKTTFNCADVGTTQPVTITATDFAGNSAQAVIMVTFQDTSKPRVKPEPPYNPFDPNSIDPLKIDVTNGPYALTAANFPQGDGGCNTVTLYFPPTTFTCAQANAPQTVSFYYVSSAGDTSPIYNKTFNVVTQLGSIIYVDAAATGANNGTSWVNAYTRLQDALTNPCAANTQVYVAQGSYRPDVGNGITLNNRNASFTIPEGYKLYGGFPTGGDVFNNRKPETFITTLTGNIGNVANATDNSYHVVTINGNNTLLDGFTIREGYANSNATDGGGGVFMQQQGTLTTLHRANVRNCKLVENFGNAGGAVYFSYTNNITANIHNFINCIFQNNTTNGGGGALRIKGSSPSPATNTNLTQCIIDNNSAAQGGGVWLEPLVNGNILNCTFSRNNATTAGGAILNNGLAIIKNSILYFDSVGITPNEVSNTGTMNVSFSNLQGSGGSSNWNASFGTNQGNNIDVNPQFIGGTLLEINPASLCRNAGQKNFINEPLDIRGNIRVLQDTVDIGAYETNPVVYVAWDAPNGGNGQTWATAYNNLQDGLDDAGLSGYQKDVWIKAGTYKPAKATNGVSSGRFNTFFVRASNGVFGGFAGNETQLTQRNIPANPTILSGDIGTANDASDNTYHVVTLNGRSPRLDGLIIEAGNANDAGNLANRSGAAIYDPGIFAEPNPVVISCVFRNNSASNNGGAIYVNNTSTNYTMDVIQSVFYGNSALRGGAVYVQKGGSNNISVKARLYNCTGVNNSAGAFNAPGFCEGNVVTTPGTANVELYNCLLLNNTTQNTGSNTFLNNTYAGTNNNDLVSISNPVGADGLLMTGDDGFRLQPGSAAINFGSNNFIHPEIKNDITNASRILQLQVDAGAYENWGCLGATKLYVDANVDTLNGNGLSWQTAFRYLNDALKMSNVCPIVDSILIAEGTYYGAGDITSTAIADVGFEISRPVKIYGGYPSGGGVRNVQAYPVFLNAEVNTPAKNDNATHIMRVAAGISDTTLIDGVNFINGYASGTGIFSFNGGSFRRAQGGALYGINSLLHVNNCRFLNNYAAQRGGAVSVSGGRFISTQSVYDRNTCNQGGGAICAEGATDTLRLAGNAFVRDSSFIGVGGAIFASYIPATSYTDVSENIFAFNSAGNEGGGLYIAKGNFYTTNNTFYKNSATGSGGGFSAPNTANVNSFLANNIFWQNTGGNGDNNFLCSNFNSILNNLIDTNPQFVDSLNPFGSDALWFTADDGLKMKRTSSAINTGNNTIIKSAKDIAGNTRIKFGTVDPGAYENENAVTRWYVNEAQTTMPEDGILWATAFAKFQDGINAAKPNDTIWVAKGNYIPDATGTCFTMKNKVKIFGGFNATETNLSQRNLSDGNNAILQGNNATVIKNDSTDNTTLLDGFVIQGGNANGNGGGMLNRNSSAQLNHLVFVNNTAAKGGAMANIQSNIQMANVVFNNNTASNIGGAVYDSATTTTITNATFYSNTAQNGGALASAANSFESIGNSIFWSNTPNEFFENLSYSAVTYSLLQTENSGAGNIVGIEPNFANPFNLAGFDGLWFTPDDGLSANYRSPFVNTGSNALSASIATDISGNVRAQNGIVDMGAYESAMLNFCDSAALNGKTKLYVNSAAIASGDGSSWSKALLTLNEALDVANYCTNIDSIFIAGGQYYPTGYKENENRRASFTLLRNGIHLLGGYSGNDSVARNPGLFNTVLNGNIGDAALATDNSFHVVTLKNVGNNCTLDGLVITGGRADSTVIPYNIGGGIYNDAQGTGKQGNPIISNCVFYNNTAKQGGALYNNGSLNGQANATVINCVFANDTALVEGGAVYNNGGTGTSSGSYINCSFSNNYSAGLGAAVCNQGAGGNNQTAFKNCVFYNNFSANGTATEQEVYNINSNASASYSVFQNGLPALMNDGGNNLYSNPIFVNTTLPKGNDNRWMTYDDGLALKYNSPAVKTGTANGAPLLAISGTVRGTLPDRGAYQNECLAANFTQNLNGGGCDSIYSPSFRKVWYSSGTYLDTIFSPIGCDSFLTVNVVMGQSKVIALSPASCGSYISPTSKTYDTTGVYTDTLQTVSGCDSIYIIQLTVNEVPAPVIIQNNNQFSTQSFATYQWLFNGVPINGATAQSYSATQSGNYSVIATNASGCSDTSSVVNFTLIGLSEIVRGTVQLYPNPNNGNFTVVFSDDEEKEIKLTDVLGKEILSMRSMQARQQISIPKPATGFYLLQIKRKIETLQIKVEVIY